VTLPNVDLTIADNRITGALERAGETGLSGELDVDAPNLEALAALMLSDIGGSAKATVRFAPEGGRQTITASFDGSNISYQTFSALTVEGTAQIANAFGTPLISGEATAGIVDAGSLRLDRVTANASVENGATRFDVEAAGSDLDLAAAGILADDAGTSVLRLNSLSGSAFRMPVRLADPVEIRLAGAQAGISNATLALGDGRIVVNGTASGALDLTVTANNVPASVVNGFAPNLGAGGTVNGRATVTGQASAPRIAWQLDWTGLQTAATRNAGLPALQLSASGDATRNETDIRGTVSGAGLSLGINGRAPFSGGGLGIAVRGAAPLALLASRSTRELRLTGTANLDLNVTGTAQSPNIAGNVTLENATAVDTDTGFGVSGATGRIVLSGQRATVERISGRLAQGGQISVAGTVDIAGALFPSNLTIRIENGRYNDGRVVNALFNADLAINGPLLGGGTLSGTVALGRTEIQLPDRLGGGATAIDVTHINTEPGFRPPQLRDSGSAAGRSASGSLRLAIELTNSGGIFVRGFGVDSEFGGSLRVTNTIADPLAVGAFQMRRGRIEFLGRRFELVSGTLTFSGDLIPVVNFAAATTTSGTAIEVHVVGPANNPTISFTSNPDLPDEEILSRLLFDRQVSRLSAVQAAQLVDAAAQLSGVGGGRGIFASVRAALGVDDLDIRQSDSGGAIVGVGKRINENLRFGVEAGSGVDGGRVIIDLDLTNNLKVRGAAGQSGSGELGLSYEREY
jgi:translocation and assembly module TamB